MPSSSSIYSRFFLLVIFTFLASCSLFEDEPDKCEDSDACNYTQEGDCEYSSCICHDFSACNYDQRGTCEYTSCYCSDTNACNYGEQDDCDYSCNCLDVDACNYNQAGECEYTSCYCQDVNACNYGLAETCSYSCAESGLYLGIVGFNRDLFEYNLQLLTSQTVYSMRNFVTALQTDNATILYHAVNRSLDNLQNATLPSDIETIAILTFTDGLDLGSIALNDDYNTGAEYLTAVNSRIRTEEFSGLALRAYSLGLEGDDVTDYDKFYNDLELLASENDETTDFSKVFEEIGEVEAEFEVIAESITTTTTTHILNLTIPVHDPGTLIRFTLDNAEISSAEESSIYIEGILNVDGSNYSLTEVTYEGLTSDSGTVVIGSVNGIDITFSFSKVADNNDNPITTTYTKQWSYIENTSSWQKNSEFDPNTDTQTDTERQSAAIILVLDCSSSLGDDFQGMKSAAIAFIDRLWNNLND